MKISVENIKVAHDGNRAEPSQGGSRHPYFLYSGVVTLEFKEKRDIRVWAGDGQKTIEGFVIFNMNMQGVASLPSGLSEPFTYSTETDGNGFTVSPAGVMTNIKRLYVPVGNNYPYPTVHPWGKGHEKCQIPFKSDPTDHLFGRPQLADDIHTWLLPGWGTDWSRERGSFQKKLVYTPAQWQAAFNPLGS
jgi:hypothetical protein